MIYKNYGNKNEKIVLLSSGNRCKKLIKKKFKCPENETQQRLFAAAFL